MEKDIKKINKDMDSLASSLSWYFLWFVFLMFTTCGTQAKVTRIENDVNRIDKQIERMDDKLDSLLGFFAPDTLQIDSTYIDTVYAD